jgi:alcohol dehydrogenase, propanol-preferring
VIAVDNRAEALELAKKVGADHVVTSDEHAATAIRDLTDGHGADVVLDFVGADATIELARTAARPLGDATIIGIAGGSVPLTFFSQPYEVSIQTTYWGSRSELVEVLELAARGLVHVESTTYSSTTRCRRTAICRPARSAVGPSWCLNAIRHQTRNMF